MINNKSTFRLVLVGESGVGKSCIINRLCNDSYNEAIGATTGAAYSSKEITYKEYGGKTILFEIWDTAGQERYRSLSKIFYQKAECIILVYDISKRDTFDDIKEYWYEQIKEFAKPKVDREEISEEEGRKYAKKIGAIYRGTSALKNIGIDELFYALGKKLCDPEYNEDPLSEEEAKKTLQLRKKSFTSDSFTTTESSSCCFSES